MSFLKNLAKNEQLINKAIDMGAKFLGGNDGTTGRASETANEEWSSHQHQSQGGTKKALFIGINYFGTKAELRGCIQDVKNIKAFIEQVGFPQENFVVLTDDQQNQQFQPTRENILNAMKWLVSGAKPGDVLFLHYSGHGSHQKDQDGDDGDGRDETICPVDYERAGMITDDEMHELMVKPLQAGVKFVSIFDCCHSHSILDLPYTYSVDGHLKIIETDNRIAAAKKFAKAGIHYMSGRKQEAVRGLMDSFKTLSSSSSSQSGSTVSKEKLEEKIAQADVIQFSGCLDSQTSADATINGHATGAMSYAFMEVMRRNNFSVSFQQLLKEIREILHGKYSQTPQMSAGRKLRMDVPFHL